MAEVNSYAKFALANYPAESNVLNTAPTYGDPINVLNGTADPGSGGTIPSADDVRNGVAVGVTTGNLRLPAEVEVANGIVFDSTNPVLEKTGNRTDARPTDVRSGVTYGPNGTDIIGILDIDAEANLPEVFEVLLGVQYGSSLQFTGTLDPAAEGTIPSANDVRLNVPVGQGVGNLIVPDPADVKLNVAYDSNGSVLGTYDCSTGVPGDAGWIG